MMSGDVIVAVHSRVEAHMIVSFRGRDTDVLELTLTRQIDYLLHGSSSTRAAYCDQLRPQALALLCS